MFKMKIWDWSNDWHGKTETFMIQSNKSRDDVLGVYFSTSKKKRELLEDIMVSEYEDSSFHADYFKELGIDAEKYEWSDKEDEVYYPDDWPLVMTQIVLDFLMMHDDSLKLKITEDTMEEFTGYQNWARNSIGFGYGLFC